MVVTIIDSALIIHLFLFCISVLLLRLTTFDTTLSLQALDACRACLPRLIEKPTKEDEPSKLCIGVVVNIT